MGRFESKLPDQLDNKLNIARHARPGIGGPMPRAGGIGSEHLAQAKGAGVAMMGLTVELVAGLSPCRRGHRLQLAR
jgi:hypothetical protein